MWRLWTPGWYLSGWWHWVKESVPMWLAFRLPRKVALWAFIRVTAATGENPDLVTYRSAYDAWEAGAGR